MAAPRTREKIISGVSESIMRTGAGLGIGPVGNVMGYLGRPGKRGLMISSIVSFLTFIVSTVLLFVRPSGNSCKAVSAENQNDILSGSY